MTLILGPLVTKNSSFVELREFENDSSVEEFLIGKFKSSIIYENNH